MNILAVTGVDQCFRTGFWLRQVKVLHGIELAVPERSIFGFLGANGAGKTTLIQLVVGLRPPTQGSVLVGGHPAASREARSRIGYLPERPYFYDHLTGDSFLRFFGSLSGLKRPHVADRVPQVLKAVGMSHARHLELRKYSKGMLQRIGIAQAILHEPEFLVLDEPMSGLDPIGRKDMRELITGLAAEGRTIFFSTHVIPDVEAICDQVALIQKGRMVGMGPISGFLSSSGPMPTEIVVGGLAIDRIRGAAGEGATVRETPDGARVVVESQERADRAILAMLQSGGKVIAVNPIRPTLESFFEKG